MFFKILGNTSGTLPDVKNPVLLDNMPKESLEKWKVNNCGQVDA